MTFRGPLRSETTLHAGASGRREGAVWLGALGREGGAAGGPAWGPGSQAAGRAGSEEDQARIPRARVGQDTACRRRKGVGTLQGRLGQHPPPSSSEVLPPAEAADRWVTLCLKLAGPPSKAARAGGGGGRAGPRCPGH